MKFIHPHLQCVWLVHDIVQLTFLVGKNHFTCGKNMNGRPIEGQRLNDLEMCYRCFVQLGKSVENGTREEYISFQLGYSTSWNYLI